MPTAAKRSDNMAKHMTQAELDARQQAEAEVLPDRGRGPKLKKPVFVRDNRPANAYWNQIVKRMEGLAILDDLDSEMLAGYCSMLARRDQTIALINQLMALLGVNDAVASANKTKAKGQDAMSDEEWEASAHQGKGSMSPDELIEAVSKLDTLTGKLQALERNILQYADKLGLTPSGRMRLAQKRAEQAAQADPDGDLYGD